MSKVLDQLPINVDAEADTLACILRDGSKLSASLDCGLNVSDFHDPAHREIFAAMLTLRGMGQPPEMALLLPWLKQHTSIENPGGVMGEILKRQAIGTSAAHYTGLAIDSGIRRELHVLSESMLIAANNGKHIDAIIGDSRETFERIAARGRQSGPRPILFGQLQDDYPELDEPIVDGLIRRCEVGNIVSGSKIGKSWLSYCLAMNVISGRTFLGKFPCKPGRVLLIDNELRKKTIAKRIPAVSSCMGVPDADVRLNLDVWSLRGELLDLHAIIRGLHGIEPRSYQLIILDAWYRSLPVGVSENDNAQVMQLYNEIDRIAERLECAWLNVHHSSKGSQSEKSVTDVGAGAGSQSRCVDAHIVFRQHQEPDAIVLDAALRSFAPIEPMVLRWQFPLWMPDDSLDPGKLKGKQTASEQRQDARDGEGITKLAAAFSDGPATISILRGRSGLSKDRCQRLLDMLEAKGSIRWTEQKIRGNTCRMYEAINLDDINGGANEPF